MPKKKLSVKIIRYNKPVVLLFILLFGCAKNNIELEFKQPLNRKDFKIEMEVLEDKSPKSVVFNGHQVFEFVNEYGENE